MSRLRREIVEPSPFPYQGPLAPAEVRGRDELLFDLGRRMTEHRVTALLGPRRYGKTSVLRRLADDLDQVDTIWVDLYGAATHADLAAMFARGLVTAGQRAQTTADRLAVTAGINLAAVQFELSRSASQRPDPRTRYRELVELTVQAARRTPVLLVLDEFQAIGRVDQAAAVLRSALQHHYRDLAIIFAGSEPSMMRDLFARDDQPFFGQADLVAIEPLTLSAVRDIVGHGFVTTGFEAGTLAGSIFGLTHGHPQRTMMAADAAWRRARSQGVDEDLWPLALEDLRDAVESSLSARFVEFGTDQQKVLRLVAHGEALFGTGGDRLQLSSGGGTSARDRLLAEGKLVDRDGDLVVTDPLMADWLRRKFPR